MKNVIKSFAALAASLLTLNACQRELIPDQPVQEELFYVTFVAEEPVTKTTVEQGTDGEGNKFAKYSWTASDANSERWTVYRDNVKAQTVTATLSEGLMTVSAGFATDSKAGDSFVALFNKGVSSVQNIPNDAESVYDPASDVMVSAPVAYETGVFSYGFRFKRLGAIGKATVMGLTGMEALVDAKLIATDGTVIAADYDVEKKAFAATGSTSITVKGIDCYPDANNNFSFYFITVPTGSVNLKLLATVWDEQLEEKLFVKQFARPITGFSNGGDVFAFNVSGFTEVTTRASFNINGEVTSKPVYEGEPVEFPEAPATIAGYDFVGWGTSPISGTQAEAPELVETSTAVMGNANVTYYAVYAKTTGHGTATHTITYDTENIPSSYGASADVVLNGVTFNVTQMYKNGEKMQWRAAGNANGTGALYNKDAFNSIQSVAITYTNEDNKKNFTVKVGDSVNPTSGTDIDAAQVGETDTFVYDCSSSAPSYFVLTNGENAGYLSSIVITYLGGEPTYADYCTSIDTRTVTSLAWSAPLATVKLNGGDNEFPELTGDPEEVLAGVVYSSSETSVADIDEKSGAVTLKAVGETTITATFPDDDPDYQPSSASYTLVVTAPAKHTVTFSINGNTSSEEVDENDPIEFPNDPEISGVVFRGWTKNAIVGTQAQAPTMVDTDEETMGNADVTYYAVFATATMASTFTDTKLSSNSFSTTGTYVLVANESSSSTTLHYFSSYSSTTANISWGVTSTTATDAITFTLSGTANALVAKDASGNYIQAIASGNFRMNSTSQTLTLKSDGTIYNPTSTSYNLRYNHNNGSGGFRWYSGTTGTSAYFYERVFDTIYSDYCTTVVTLSSVVVSGTASKTNYKAGESFDFTGLVATAVYSDGSEVTVTGEAQWAPTSALAAGTTSVNVTATYNDVTSEAFPVNITVVTLNGITIKTAPTKVTYTEGEMFNPAGLVIYRHYSDETKDELAYAGHESDFSFNPALDDALETSHTTVTITYGEKSANQSITVNEKQVPTFSSLEALVAADVASGTEVKVTFENVPIKSIYVTNGGYRNGIYFDIQKGGKDIEIYYQNVPNDWAAEGTVSGTMTCPWKNFNGTWELAPEANTWDWNNLSYTAPLEPCATPEISITDAGSATISCGTAGATIYYTLGDSPADPTSASTRYTGAVTMTDGQTIKAIAYKDGMKASEVNSKKYTTAQKLTYSFTIQTSDFNTTSYVANNGSHDFTATCTTDKTKTMTVSCTSNQVMKNSDVMQWQSGKGYIYNTTDLGTIKSVTVNSTAGTFTTNYGTSEHPTSGTTVGNGFFTVKVGSATGKTSSVVVTFEK